MGTLRSNTDMSTVSLNTANASGYLAEGPARALLVLAHGAGAGQRHPFMVDVARRIAARGIAVVTFDFPYMQARRRAPDRPPALEACFEDVLGAAREWQRGTQESNPESSALEAAALPIKLVPLAARL